MGHLTVQADLVWARLARALARGLLSLVWLGVVLAGGVSLVPRTALAESVLAELSSFDMDRNDEGVFLSTVVRFDLPTVVDDVLRKGIPVYFVAEAQLRRDRWYWLDKRVHTTTRHLRLAYQPLLRRWRLQVSATPINNQGLGVTLSQNFDALSDALASAQRLSRWKVAEPSMLDADASYHLDFTFRLDVSQLPRPFQIGALGQSDWTLAVARSQKLPPDVAKEAPKDGSKDGGKDGGKDGVK
jgi:Domain of unknown function (DUF4390)